MPIKGRCLLRGEPGGGPSYFIIAPRTRSADAGSSLPSCSLPPPFLAGIYQGRHCGERRFLVHNDFFYHLLVLRLVLRIGIRCAENDQPWAGGARIW